METGQYISQEPVLPIPRDGGAAVAGDGSFSPTADGYDRRIEPVASLPRWLGAQQRDEYPRREPNRRRHATGFPPPERERCEEQTFFLSPRGPHIPGWKCWFLDRTGHEQAMCVVDRSSTAYRAMQTNGFVGCCRKRGGPTAMKWKPRSQPVDTVEDGGVPEFQSQPVVTARLVWPRPSGSLFQRLEST